MSQRPDQSTLDAFLAADEAARESVAIAEVLDELEMLVHRDAEKVVGAATAIASFAQPRGRGGAAARALRSGATATAYLGRHSEALELTRNARELAQDSGENVEAARALVAGMQPLCETGRVDEAISDGELARTELLDANEPLLAARVDLNLGNVFKVQGDAAKALGHLDRVIDTLPDADPIRPHALNAVGECRLVLDDHVGADAAFREAVTLLGENGGFAGALIVGNRADVAAREGRLQEAIDLFAEAQRRLDAQGAEGHAARLKIEAAEALEIAGLYDEAAIELEAGLEALEASELAFESARATFAIGRLHLRAGRGKTAADHLDNATRRFNELGNVLLANRTLLAAVEACIESKRFDEAAVRLAMAGRAIEGSYDQALFAHHEGLLHEAEGRIEDALEAANRAYAAASDLGIRPLSVELEARRSWLLRQAGAITEAVEAGRHATEEVERIRGELQGERLRAAFLSSRIGAHEAYVTALLADGGVENTRRAFEVVEQARNRSLVERISRQLEGRSPDREDAPEIAQLRQRLNALYASLANDGLEDQRRLHTNTRQHEIDALEIQIDRHLVELDRSSPSIDTPISFEQIRESICEGTALFEYFIANDDLIIFTLLDGELDVVTCPGVLPEIERLVTELHFQCRRRLRGEASAALDKRMRESCNEILKSLHQDLLAPIESKFREADRWLVVPHGPLVAVPFHALFDGEEYVIDRTVVSIAPSAAAAIRLADITDRGHGTLVATVGDDRAPSIQAEGNAVAALHAERTDVIHLDDSDVTVDRLLKALSEVRIAHIACHGRFLASSPRSSGLRLSDRWLTVRDIHELDVAPPVVVLSGCETGLHPRDGADELLGLTRGFAANGSRAVVASLWSVHDAASTNLMTTMHESLAKKEHETGERVADALRTAQLQLRERHPHPAFWAPFFCSESPAGTRTQSSLDVA